jgi:hypothetical protein
MAPSTTSTFTPFADPLWLTRNVSAYYKDSHRRLQREVRKYVESCISPYCEEWEAQGTVPANVRHPLSAEVLEIRGQLLIQVLE